MPRDFIPNVDDANVEIVRLDSQLVILQGQVSGHPALIKAKDDEIVRIQGLADVATKDLEGANTKVTDLTTQLDTKTKDVTKLQGELQTEKTKATKTIAQAGTKPLEEATTTTLEKKSSDGLTGLQRAIAARADEIKANGGFASK